jgi:hypothetical protein
VADPFNCPIDCPIAPGGLYPPTIAADPFDCNINCNIVSGGFYPLAGALNRLMAHANFGGDGAV